MRKSTTPRRTPVRSESASDAIKRILDEPETRKAFKRLIAKGMGQEELSYLLRMIPTLPDSKPELKIPGKTKDGARKFPNRIEKLAADIEAGNNKSGFLGELMQFVHIEANTPTRTLEKKAWFLKGGVQHTLKTFKELPSVLRCYAAYLRFAIQQVGLERLSFQRWTAFSLFTKVDMSTGSLHESEIVCLLDAAFNVAERPKPTVFGDENLRKFYKYHSRIVESIRRTQNASQHSTTRKPDSSGE